MKYNFFNVYSTVTSFTHLKVFQNKEHVEFKPTTLTYTNDVFLRILGAASGSFPLSSLASPSSDDNNDEFTAKGGHTSLNDSPIAALRRQKHLGIKAELRKEGNRDSTYAATYIRMADFGFIS